MADKYDIILIKRDPDTEQEVSRTVLEEFEDLGAPHPTLGGRVMAWQNSIEVNYVTHEEE